MLYNSLRARVVMEMVKEMVMEMVTEMVMEMDRVDLGYKPCNLFVFCKIKVEPVEVTIMTRLRESGVWGGGEGSCGGQTVK